MKHFSMEDNNLQCILLITARLVLTVFFIHCVYFFRIVDERDSSGDA
ncbi:MAG: hypothetical protein HOB52_04990 [Euryarchaeota archaeon]|nr:hypothetical protein [Euryarchaeota archaeon]